MALATRFSRLLKADLHAVLDRLEEPDVLLRQAIREMEEGVASRARRCQARGQERRQVEARLAELSEASAAHDAELDLCFQANEETLARNLLRRRLETRRLDRHLRQVRARLDEVQAEESAVLEGCRRRLEALRQRAQALDLGPKTASPPGGVPDLVVTDDDVELAWLRERQKRSAS